LALAACGAKGADSTRPRNVVLISIDTLRPDHLGCYGYARETSPTIDALAAGGVRFADATSSAPWTLPAHTTMFTGLYPSHHGVKDYEHRLPASAVTLAEVLRDQGFQTFAAVNTWNIADPRFEIFQGFAPGDLVYVRETAQVQGGGQVILNTGREVVAKAEAALRGRDGRRPFFLFLHLYDAHTDYTPSAEYRERFVSPYGGALQGDSVSTGQLFEIRARNITLGARDVQFLREMYDAEIRATDDILAGFLAFLEESGLARDTLIVFTSDHGEEFQEHGGLLHGRTQFQELLAVPLIVRGPGVPRGVVVEEPVSLVDLFPTVLGCLGLPLPGPVDGLDLASAWNGGRLAPRALFGEADHNNVVDGKPVVDIKRMARFGDEKLHVDRHSGAVALYDLAKDPGEARDLAAERAERVAVLRAALSRFLDGEVTSEASGAELSDENLELLRELGYAGDEEH
jgi:arylsulfatase A-like enzyme